MKAAPGRDQETLLNEKDARMIIPSAHALDMLRADLVSDADFTWSAITIAIGAGILFRQRVNMVIGARGRDFNHRPADL